MAENEKELYFDCFSCGERFSETFPEDHMVANARDMGHSNTGRNHVISANGVALSDGYEVVECPICHMEGPHDIKAPDAV